MLKLDQKEKVKIVKEALTADDSISSIARENNVCRKTVYDTIKQLAPNNKDYMKKNEDKKLTGNKEIDTLI